LRFLYTQTITGYAGNPNNNNGWLEADDYLHGELEAMANEPMVVLDIEEVAEPVAEAEEEQVVTLIVDIEEEQMASPVIDMEEDLAALFGDDDDFEDDDFSDDDSEGVEEEEPPSVYEVGGPSTVANEGLSFTLLIPGLPGVRTWEAGEESDTGTGDGVLDGSYSRKIGAGWCLG
nr:hypothetical protein [Tanacetum cinerariifolium]